jgi:hypothetical protein
MTDSKDFSPEAVLAAVAAELRYNRDDLEVTWDETVSPRVTYEVVGKSNRMRLVVYRSEADAEAVCQDTIHEDLFKGGFFVVFSDDLRREVLDAMVKVCNLSDLTPYLTMAVREGWAMSNSADDDLESSEQTIGNAQTIPEIKAHQAALLVKWLKDPVAAVWRLQGGDLPSTMAVLIEQCSFDVDALTKALMVAMGGWRAFGICTVTATTPEGFVIEADNDEASAYLESLYADSQDEPPATDRGV